jgi:hypothetical protein
MHPRKLSFDLNLLDLSVSGFWFCRACHKVTEPLENYAGVNGCLFCSSPRIKWCPPVFEPKPRYENKETVSAVRV